MHGIRMWHIPLWLLNPGPSTYSVQPPIGILPSDVHIQETERACVSYLRSWKGGVNKDLGPSMRNKYTHFTSFLKKPRHNQRGLHEWLSLQSGVFKRKSISTKSSTRKSRDQVDSLFALIKLWIGVAVSTKICYHFDKTVAVFTRNCNLHINTCQIN
jgi:hypothetical protein